MRISDVVRVDPDFRLFHKARSLQTALRRRWAWYARHVPDRLTALHKLRFDEVGALLQSEITEAERGRPPLWEINTYLSRRPLLRLPTNEVLDWVFYNLPPPKRATLTELEQHIAELMTMRYHQAQAKQHYFALMCEIAYRAHQGWYFIFNTLTLAPKVYYEIAKNQSKYYKTYIRAIDNDTAAAAYGSVRNAMGHQFHLYFTCTEQGALNGRLHLHCMHLVKALPREASDPNYGLVQPLERNLAYYKRYWPHGRSEPRIVRYSPNDAFGKDGYRWPLDHRTLQPLEIRSPLAIANYISKYVEKGYQSCLRHKIKWRVKKSHKLGHALLNEMLEPLSTSTLQIIASLDSLNLKLNNEPIPLTLLRLLSLKQLRNRQSSKNTSPSATLSQIAKSITPRLSPLHSLRASTKTIQESSQQSTQFLSTLGYNNADISNALNELRIELRKTNDKYFRRSPVTGGTTSSSHQSGKQKHYQTQTRHSATRN